MKSEFFRGVLVVLLLTFISGYTGTSALQEEITPDWVIRSNSSLNLIQFDVFTNEGEIAQDEFYPEFVSFALDTASYVYIFNVSSASSDGTRDIHMLMPNSIDTDNYFEAGEYSISPDYIIENEPQGTAYIQAFAAPYPINVTFSSDETFTFQGIDPELFFRTIELKFESQGLLSSEYAADWAAYAIRGGGIEAFAAGSRCTKIRINVPQAQADTVVNYTVDANCVNGASLSGQFTGPESKKIAQVLEGERTITVSLFGYEETTTTGVAEFGRTTEFEIVAEVPEESYGILVSDPAPSIYEEIVFTPNLQTFRPISNYFWDFGDGNAASFTSEEFVEMGGSVTHQYTEGSFVIGDDGSTRELPYRVRLMIEFADGNSPTSEVTDLELSVDEDPIPGSCPPSTVGVQEFARSILMESTETGCATVSIPAHLLDTSALTHDGQAELINQFNWEALPQDARIQALLFVTFQDSTGRAIGEQKRFSMLKEDTGFFTMQPVIEVPNNATLGVQISFNVIDNPSGGRVALEAGPFEISSITNCSNARLYPDNSVTQSKGDGISFAVGSDVKIFFENIGCADILLDEGSIVIKRNGEAVARIINSADVVSANRLVSWTWNQSNDSGIQVPEGLYTVEIQTDQGLYATEFWIIN